MVSIGPKWRDLLFSNIFAPLESMAISEHGTHNMGHWDGIILQIHSQQKYSNDVGRVVLFLFSFCFAHLAGK